MHVNFNRKYLNAEIGSFFKIVPTVVQQMGDVFPEIRKKEQYVEEILDEEERAFALSLDRGEAKFNKYARRRQSKGLKNLPGAYVWRLYHTYGFPADLTKLMAEECWKLQPPRPVLTPYTINLLFTNFNKEQGLNINDEEVSLAQEEAREARKGEKKGASDLVTLDVHDIAVLERMDDVPKTKETAKYKRGAIKSTIRALYHGKFLKSTSEVPEGEQFGVLLDKTNFYAESGGQEFDTGRLTVDSVVEVDVRNFQSYGGYVLHTGYIQYGSLSVGDEIAAEYDELRRQQIQMNHTGNHVLNFTLRQVLGGEVYQKGSLVAPEKLRFDFSHKASVTDEELKNIEDISNKFIKDNMEDPDPVRVVSIGMSVDKLVSDVAATDWLKYSIEFCGGTHVDRTGEIKELIVLEESGIAKGIRRIVAVTGQNTIEVRITSPRRPKQKEIQKAQVGDAIRLVETHLDQNKASTSFLAKLPASSSAKAISEAIKRVTKNKGNSVYFIRVDDVTDKVIHECFVAPEQASRGLVAIKWVAQVAGVVGGKAGGKGATGVGSGMDVSKMVEGVEVAVKYLEKLNI
ncbi:MAG: Alanine--tRNA ligase [Geoglossum simile]|nr:MAG: Alanine--tRNA ligase [Geoglossum simile]